MAARLPETAGRSFTTIDLFAGAGGMSLGFAKAGFRSLVAVDCDAGAVATYRQNFDTPALRSLVDPQAPYPRPLVVIGGPPCQGFSSAGSRRTGDKRNTLVSTFATVVNRLRPRAFVFENVEGFLTAEGGLRIVELLEPLIDAGYRIHLRKVNAANFGVPQNRKRVIAIGGLQFNPTFPRPTHRAFGAPGRDLSPSHLPTTMTVGEALDDLEPPSLAPPGQPSDHYSTRITGSRLDTIVALRPGQTMRDLPERYWHKSYRQRAFRRVPTARPQSGAGVPQPE